MLKTTSVLQSAGLGFVRGGWRGWGGGGCTLCQCLDLGGLDADATEPDDALYHDRGGQRADGHGGERCRVPRPPWQQFRDGLLQYLQERDDHDDGEDEDPEGFEPSAAHGEFVLQASDLPLDELIGCPDDQGAEQVEGGVYEGSDEREGGGGEGGDDFGDEEDDVCYHVDLG